MHVKRAQSEKMSRVLHCKLVLRATEAIGTKFSLQRSTRFQALLVTLHHSHFRDHFSNRSRNFHLIQLRMRVEQGFVLLNAKWRISCKSIGVELECLDSVCNADARLHDIITDDDGRLQLLMSTSAG